MLIWRPTGSWLIWWKLYRPIIVIELLRTVSYWMLCMTSNASWPTVFITTIEWSKILITGFCFILHTLVTIYWSILLTPMYPWSFLTHCWTHGVTPVDGCSAAPPSLTRCVRRRGWLACVGGAPCVWCAVGKDNHILILFGHYRTWTRRL